MKLMFIKTPEASKLMNVVLTSDLFADYLRTSVAYYS